MKTPVIYQKPPENLSGVPSRRKFVAKDFFSYANLDRWGTFILVMSWLASIISALSGTVISDQQFAKSFLSPLNAAICFGGAILLPVFWLTIFRAGKSETRHANAVGQILMAGLFTYLLGRSPEVHLHIFLPLALLSLYRDWRVLVTAMCAAIAEHFIHYLQISGSTAEFFANSWHGWSESFWWLCGMNLLLIVWWMQNESNARRRNNLKERLEKNEQRYRNFVETAEDLIYRCDAKGYFTFINRAFTDLLGYSNDDENLHYLQTVAPHHRHRVKRFYLRQMLKKQFRTYLEFPVIGKNGEEIWLGQKVQLFYENDELKGFQAFARDISEVKKAQNELAESEEKYRFLANFLPQHVWRMDQRGVFTYCNDQTFNYFGLDSKTREFSGLNWRGVIHPEDGRQMLEFWVNSLRTKQPFEIECRIRGGDGNYRWFLGQAVPLVNENNRVTEFFGTSTDIHDRKLAQEEAARNLEYRNLFKHANDAIVIYDPQTEDVLDVNDFACEMFGRTRGEFLAMNLGAICANSATKKENIRQILEEECLEACEFWLTDKDGRQKKLSITSTFIEFRGTPAVLTINRDVTAAFEADKALRKNEAKMRSLIENMQEGLVEVDREEKILFVNQRFCQMVGYTYDELIGQHIGEMLIDEEGRKCVAKAHKDRYEGKTGMYEMKAFHKSGRPVWFLIGGVPVTDEDGHIIGSMGVHTDITDIKHNEEMLWFNATHDALTGLPNRHLLLEHLQNAISRVAGQPEDQFALLFLDLNLFKMVNDSLGHVEGDNLLVLLARRLEECVRGGDVISRFGGDEFTILLDRITSKEGALHIVQRIQDSLKTPFILNGSEVFINTSIGIVLSDGSYQKPEEILRDADTAMYYAKTSNSTHYEIFNPQMHEQANLRLQLETDLRLAVKSKEFQTLYQPIVEIETRRIIGFEALIRWIHPVRGMVSPLDFIPLAEQNGLIIPIGEWVLRDSCRQLRQWQLQNPLNDELTISVNLSTKQFEQENLIEIVAGIIRETQINPHNLRLEVTESHLVGKNIDPVAILTKLRALGVKISIDDFGTGYSSLSYLHQLPINHLKIDRSFIKQINENQENLEIVRTIVTLAQNLNFSVIAEGIETEDQAAHLRMLECDFGQGYLYSKPVDAVQAGLLLDKMRLRDIPFREIELLSETVS